MQSPDASHDISELSQLETLFDAVRDASILKELDHVDANYAAWIAAAPFFVLASQGPEGLDCSPRGDEPGFVQLLDPKTLVIPDRRGNNRIDSLRNLVVDPRVALLFLIPGLGETLRVNGRCRINRDPELLSTFAVGGKEPKLVLVVSVESVFFQCSRALVRSKLWDPAVQVAPGTLPTPGKILADITRERRDVSQRIDGEVYDRELPERDQDDPLLMRGRGYACGAYLALARVARKVLAATLRPSCRPTGVFTCLDFARVSADTGRPDPARRDAMWIKPKFVELRFGFEVTMYSEYR